MGLTMRIFALLIVAAAAAAVPALALTQDNSAAPAPATQAKTAESDPDSRIRCRSVEVTGSLVKRGRVCRTIREWRQIAENGNYSARKMIEDSTSRQGGN